MTTAWVKKITAYCSEGTSRVLAPMHDRNSADWTFKTAVTVKIIWLKPLNTFASGSSYKYHLNTLFSIFHNSTSFPPSLQHLQWWPGWGGLVSSAKPSCYSQLVLSSGRAQGRCSQLQAPCVWVCRDTDTKETGFTCGWANLRRVWPRRLWSHPSLNWWGVWEEL